MLKPATTFGTPNAMPFTQSIIGNMPQVQIDSLPLISADVAAAGGVISIVGGNFTRYYSPTILGVSSVNAATNGGATFWLTTNFLDVRGCRSFMMLTRRHNTTALPQGGIGGGIALYYQMRFTSAENPAQSKGATENLAVCAINVISNSQIAFPALQTLGETQTVLFGWNVALGGSGAGNSGNLSIGTDVRFMVGFANDPGVLNTFSLALWAAS